MPTPATRTPATRAHGARRRTVLACAATAAIALVLAACGEDEPLLRPAPTTTLPTVTSTATAAPSASPSPTPSVEPNPAGLEPLPTDEIDASFVTIENFFKAYEYGLETGDPSALESLATSSCEVCADLSASVRAVRDDGDRAVGGGFTISTSTLVTSKDPRVAVWRLDLVQEATRVTHSDGRTTDVQGFDAVAFVDVLVAGPPRINSINTKFGN